MAGTGTCEWRVLGGGDDFSVDWKEERLNYSGHLALPAKLDHQSSGFDLFPWASVTGP